MRIKDVLKMALPLTLTLGCSLFTNQVNPSQQATRILYASLPTANAVLSVDTESYTPFGEPITGLNSPGNMVAYGDYLYVVNQAGQSVTEVNRRTYQRRTFRTGTNPWGIAISADGVYLYVTNRGDGSNGTISRIHVASGQSDTIDVNFENKNLHPMGIAVVSKTVSSKTTYYAYVAFADPIYTSGSNTPTCYVQKVTDRSKDGTPVGIPGGIALSNAVVSSDNKTLYVTDSSQNKLYSFDITDPSASLGSPATITTEGALADTVTAPSAGANNKFIYGVYRDNVESGGNLYGRLFFTQDTTARKVAITGGLSPNALAISSDGSTIFVAASNTLLWMDAPTSETGGIGHLFRLSEDQNYQKEAIADITLAGGVPNQK